MSAFIHHISTLAAPFLYSQSHIRDKMQSWTSDAKSKRLLNMLYKRSGIETRSSVLPDFLEPENATLFLTGQDQRPINPGTMERNMVYAEQSRGMAVELAKKTLAGSGFRADQVTHVVFASCTGFANPGPDFHIINELGLSDQVQRYTLGFMGCYAAFPALRMAAQFCEADETAVVLVMCLELCTLHMQLDDRQDSMLANSLFADGAAAAMMSAREPEVDRPAFRVERFCSSLVKGGESHMAWDIGNHGFNIVLSSYVPDILGSELRSLLQRVLGGSGTALEEVEEWAVHPGGRAILDKVQQSLELPDEALAVSRQVLRDYGNMSSATVLFVLKEMLDTADSPEALTCAMAFGPGLTVETAFFQRLGCGPRKPAGLSKVTNL